MSYVISHPTRAKTKTGTYTGNAADNRNIDIGVDLASKENVHVMIKGNAATNSEARHRIEHGQGDLAMRYDGGVEVANNIQSFTSTGFQIGSSDNVNASGIVYSYIVTWEES